MLAYGGFALSHLGHIEILRALPWLGFGLFAFNCWVDSGKRCYLFCVFVATACLVLSGYPQIIVYALFVVTTYFLFARTASARTRFYAFLALILGIGATAIQLAPGMQLWFTREYIRPGEGMFEPSMGYSFIGIPGNPALPASQNGDICRNGWLYRRGSVDFGVD